MTQEGTYSVAEQSGPWLFCTINLNRGKGDCCCEWLDDLRLKQRFLHDFLLFLRLAREWTTSAMNVLGYKVYGRDYVNHFPRPFMG